MAVLGIEFAAAFGLADIDPFRGTAAVAWDAVRFAKGCKEDGREPEQGGLRPKRIGTEGYSHRHLRMC